MTCPLSCKLFLTVICNMSPQSRAKLVIQDPCCIQWEKNLLAVIVGPGNWPLTAIIIRGVPSGASVVFVISRVYYQSYD
jgi:hypothetical protein